MALVREGRWSKHIASCLAVCLLCTVGAKRTVLCGVSCFVADPVSAVIAATQSLPQETGRPNATAQPAPTPATTAAIADTETTAQGDTALSTASPVPTTVHYFQGELIGAIALVPDTGKPEATGDVIEKQYTHGTGGVYLPLAHGSIKNVTSRDNAGLSSEIGKGMPFAIVRDSEEPQVLIMHTHATETYRLYEGLYYDLADTARTTDRALDVCAVGKVMAAELNAAGICTLHDETLNDYPSYTASYDNSRAVVEQYLAQYPSIKLVIDVHRDAIESEGVRYAPVAQVNGKQSAQVMLIAGCDNGASIDLPNCMENLRFAAAWETQMEGDFAGLTRPVLFDYRFYNQDLTTGSLLLEVGGHGNTLNEALYAGQLAARSLAQLLCASEGE